MFPLLRLSLLHLFRARLLVFTLGFAFFIHFVSLKVMGNVNIEFQGATVKIGAKEALFAALFFQLFVGFFVAAVYGIWMVPYSHQGSRSALTHVLPVSRWMFPLVYSLTFLVLLFLEHLAMLASLGIVYGGAAFSGASTPWLALLTCLGLQSLASLVLMNGFAVSSMSFGQIPTFFIGLTFLFVSYVASAAGKFASAFFSGVQEPQALYWARKIYEKLPPLGELAFDLRQIYRGKIDAGDHELLAHVILWSAWFLVFVLLLRWKLRYPTLVRSAEN